MPRIQQLPTSVITKIAAGEVIERPASVVKELLENAVDAGSKRIDVDVEQGGMDMICIVDDGCGIEPDDLQLAFASHATSKLQNADDLFRIGTLGFRGEALASIGGVAHVCLQSRTVNQIHGAEISCNGGELSPIRAWNGSAGTRIEVRNLFFNTPVRRKFLKSVATEMGHIDETFTKLALAAPHLDLTLTHHGKKVYTLPSSTNLPERIGLFFGTEIRDKLFEVKSRQGPASLSGFIADPACDRGNAKMQYLFLNGRWIRDRSLGHAIQEAYRGLLMTGRYAITFLFLDLPADLVDVNIHPTKAEVRFRDGQALYHLVLSTIRERLRAADLTARLQVSHRMAGPEGEPRFVSPFKPQPWSLSAPSSPTPPLPFPKSAPAAATNPPARSFGAMDSLAAADSNSNNHEDDHRATAEVELADATTTWTPAPENFNAIQLHDAYLVLETPEGMLVIDQHALHERILFEQLKNRFRTGALEKQPLLIPEPIELPTEQAALVLEHQAALADLGIDISDFGGSTLLLSSYPAILGKRSPGDILKAVIDHLVSKERAPNREQLLNDLLSVMACRAAVKAGDRLTPDEIAALIAQRELAADIHHCPHGRPTALLFSKQDLDRQFRRT